MSAPGRGFASRVPALHAAAALTLLLAVAWTYAPALDNAFVWDDWTNIVAQRAWRTWDAAGWQHVTHAFVAGHYQPITWLSYMLQERAGYGAARDYHALDIGLHALNALLVAALCTRLLAMAQPTWSGLTRAGAAWLTAAAFALHPLRVESVAWATERRDLLSASGFLLALLAYLAGQRPGAGTALWRLSTALAFALGALAKAQVALPLVLVLLDVWPLRRQRSWREWLRSGWLEKLPLFGIALVVGLVALQAQRASGALLTWQEHALGARLAQSAYGLVFYLRANWASCYSPLHERPFPLEPWSARFLLPVLLLTLVVLGLMAWRRRPASLVAALVWYVLWLLPVLGFFQSGAQLVAERYSYLATLGPTLWVAGASIGWVRGRARSWRVGLAALLLMVLASWALASRAQVAVWRDDVTLWTHVLRCGRSAVAHNNLAVLAAGRGELAAAWDHAREALATVPSYARPWLTLVTLLERDGVVAPEAARAALPTLEAAHRWQVRSSTATYALGLAQARAGQHAAAVASLEAALRLRPDHVGARRTLVGLGQGDFVQGH